MVKVRGKERKRIYIPKKVKQRGIGKEIDRKEATVFDFMPVILGNEFRTNDILSRQLFRDPPARGPFMLMNRAYPMLGTRYFNEEEITPALECYKFTLDAQTGFISFVSSVQNALLTQEEISNLRLGSPLETSLINELSMNRKDLNIDIEEYARWLEGLRTLKNQRHLLNKEVYSLCPFNGWDKIKGVQSGYHKKLKKWVPTKNYPLSNEFKDCAKQYIDICVSMGKFDEAIHFAQYFETSFQRRISSQKPKEILDVKWLKKYIDENHPESSIGR